MIWNTNIEGDPNRVFVIPDDKMKVYRANLALYKNYYNGANQLRMDSRALSAEVNIMEPNLNNDYFYVYPKSSFKDFLAATHFGIEGFSAGYYDFAGSTTDYWKDYYSVKKFNAWW